MNSSTYKDARKEFSEWWCDNGLEDMFETDLDELIEMAVKEVMEKLEGRS